MKLSDLKINPGNPRLIKDEKFKKLCQSLRDFPEMMELRPIIVDENFIIQGGNMRYNGLVEIGYKEIPDSWVRQRKDFTPEQWREFIIKDNVGFGEWDFDMLANEWDTDLLEQWGVDLPAFPGAGSDPFDDQGETIKNQFAVIIICDGEKSQEEIFNKMTQDGYNCKIAVV